MGYDRLHFFGERVFVGKVVVHQAARHSRLCGDIGEGGSAHALAFVQKSRGKHNVARTLLKALARANAARNRARRKAGRIEQCSFTTHRTALFRRSRRRPTTTSESTSGAAFDFPCAVCTSRALRAQNLKSDEFCQLALPRKRDLPQKPSSKGMQFPSKQLSLPSCYKNRRIRYSFTGSPARHAQKSADSYGFRAVDNATTPDTPAPHPTTPVPHPVW